MQLACNMPPALPTAWPSLAPHSSPDLHSDDCSIVLRPCCDWSISLFSTLSSSPQRTWSSSFTFLLCVWTFYTLPSWSFHGKYRHLMYITISLFTHTITGSFFKAGATSDSLLCLLRWPMAWPSLCVMNSLLWANHCSHPGPGFLFCEMGVLITPTSPGLWGWVRRPVCGAGPEPLVLLPFPGK